MLFWNKLYPSRCKECLCFNYFKSGLDVFKSQGKSLGICASGNFQELSNEVLNRIESGNYLENKLKHNMYLKENPFVTKKKNIH